MDFAFSCFHVTFVLSSSSFMQEIHTKKLLWAYFQIPKGNVRLLFGSDMNLLFLPTINEKMFVTEAA